MKKIYMKVFSIDKRNELCRLTQSCFKIAAAKKFHPIIAKDYKNSNAEIYVVIKLHVSYFMLSIT